MCIAICDDNITDLKIIKGMLDEFLSLNNISIDVREFSHPDELLIEAEHNHFCLYILDIVMPMVNGIEIGRNIRLLDFETQIIYVTGEAGFALESFDANPSSYILKPVNKEKLFKALNFAISKINMEDEKVVSIKISTGLRTIQLSQILYFEYVNHKIRYFLLYGDFIETRYVSENFATYIIPFLRSARFVKTHESFVVNIAYITHLSRTSVTIRGKYIVPVSRSNYINVRDKYLICRIGDMKND